MFIILGVIVLFVIVGLYIYIKALGDAWKINTPDDRPFFITTEPITVKKILLPVGTKILFERQYFWQKYEQKKMLKNENIVGFCFHKELTVEWAGVPISSISKFYNTEMSGYSVYADFNALKAENETEFSKLWKQCNDGIGITVKNTEDWSFNKHNILDVQSCSVSYQRYFKEDAEQQRFLDHLRNELMKLSS